MLNFHEAEIKNAGPQNERIEAFANRLAIIFNLDSVTLSYLGFSSGKNGCGV